MTDDKYRYPMIYPYSEQIIHVRDKKRFCFAQWIGPDKVIFGHRRRLYIRDTVRARTIANPLQESIQPEYVNCLRSNPSQTRLAVGIGTLVIVYDIPALHHYNQIYSEGVALVDEVCWIDDDSFAIVNSSGEIVIRIWEDGDFIESQREILAPPYGFQNPESFKHNIFEYHSGYKEFIYLSQVRPILYMMKADLLTPPRTKSFAFNWNMNYITRPLMIAVDSSCPHYFIANHKTIFKLDPETLNATVCKRWKGCYSLSVADHIITYSIKRTIDAVHFRDIQTQQDSIYSLVSPVSSFRRRKLPSRIPKKYKPRINIHSYSDDRTKIFCAGTLKNPVSGDPSIHLALWTIQFPNIQPNSSSESP